MSTPKHLRIALFSVLLLSAVSACGGAQSSGGCQLPGMAPRLAGTPIPTQPIPTDAIPFGSAFSVVISVTVDANGTLTSASIAQTSTISSVDAAALRLVRNSTFEPGNAGCGTQIPSTTTVTVNFG
ncbi:MAG: TonB family protein [Vulcanimicrobiaceae bacterium]